MQLLGRDPEPTEERVHRARALGAEGHVVLGLAAGIRAADEVDRLALERAGGEALRDRLEDALLAGREGLRVVVELRRVLDVLELETAGLDDVVVDVDGHLVALAGRAGRGRRSDRVHGLHRGLRGLLVTAAGGRKRSKSEERKRADCRDERGLHHHSSVLVRPTGTHISPYIIRWLRASMHACPSGVRSPGDVKSAAGSLA